MTNLLTSLSLLTTSLALSAFDLPVQLPSGQIFYLNMEYVEIDRDSYSVHMDFKIQDPEELRLFSEDSDNLTQLMRQSLKDEWGARDFDSWLRTEWTTFVLPKFEIPSLSLLKIERPTSSPLPSPSPTKPVFGICGTTALSISRNSTLSNNTSSIGTLLLTSGSLTCTDSFSSNNRCLLSTSGGTIKVSVGNTYTFTGTISSNNMPTEGILLTPTISAESPIFHCGTNTDTPTIDKPIETILSVATERTDPSSSTDEEVEKNEVPSNLDTPVESSPDKETPMFSLNFSTLGSDFGGGWRLAPCELRFVKKQSSRMENRDIKDDIEMITLLVAPVKSELYQKQYASSDLLPFKDESSLLTYNSDSTFTLRSTSQETFLFNPTGQLIHSLRSDGFSSTYDYCDGKLIAIHHADYPDLFFEYEEVKVTTIHGLPSTIHLEYDDQDHLCRIYDDQGSFLQISYDEDGDFYKITDDSDAILFKRSERVNRIEAAETIPLLFNGFGEVFYYKDSQNNLKISFKSWEDEDDE